MFTPLKPLRGRAPGTILLTLILLQLHLAAAPTFIDLSAWSPVHYTRFEQGPGIWQLGVNNVSVTQTRNSDPTIFISDFTLVSQRIRGTWRVDDDNDDDLMGFVFGFQDDRHFYLFDWKQTRQAVAKRGIAEAGMSVKVINASSAIGPADFWATYPANTNRVHTLYHNSIPWKSYTDYEWELDFLPGFVHITVSEGTNLLDVIQLSINAYPTGRFGFYDSSQASVSYSQFTTEPLPPRPAISISDASAVEGNGAPGGITFLVSLSEPSAETISALVSTRPGSASPLLDYLELSGTPILFPPGETNTLVTVPVIPDLIHEPDETFSIHLSRVENAVFGRVDATGTLLDDDLGTNDPPVIQITGPAGGTVYNSPAPFPIRAGASDPDGQVVRVDFFAGNTLVGTAHAEPYEVSFQPDALGDYTFTAVATDDDSATAVSAPVTVSVRTGASADVAIVRNFASSEIDLMRDYLAEMQYTSLVFDQEGLTLEALAGFRVVIWDDLGEVEGGLSGNDVTILGQLFDADVALYFIGEHLGSSAANLDEIGRARWRQLTRLNALPVAEATGFVTTTTNTHPVSNGPFGTVVGFPHPPTMDPAVRAGTGEGRIAFSGETDIVLAYEAPDGLVRTVTQNVLVSSAPECGLIERKRLFKNAIWWLMQEFDPPFFLNLFLDMEQSHSTLIAGNPVTYTITASHSGELGANEVVVVNHLAPGMTFVSASTPGGTCTNQCGVVVCELGVLGYSYQSVITITAIPSQAGLMTNQATISANDPEPRIVDNQVSTVLEVIDPGEVSMELALERISPEELRLRLEAPAGLRYLIESSGNMEDWELREDFISAGSVTSFTHANSPLTARRFYRARLYSE